MLHLKAPTHAVAYFFHKKTTATRLEHPIRVSIAASATPTAAPAADQPPIPFALPTPTLLVLLVKRVILSVSNLSDTYSRDVVEETARRFPRTVARTRSMQEQPA